MSTTTTPTDTDRSDSSTEYKYVVVRTDGTHTFDYETRHEAIGAAAIYGGSVVPIVESCLVHFSNAGPTHLGNKYYGDRQIIPTTHGKTRIDRIDIVRQVNGNTQETVESYWRVACPECYREFESEDGSEDARGEVIDRMLECCDIEWFPPSDWVDNCEICGSDHRGEYNCEPPAWREPFPGVECDYTCVRCGWSGPGKDLQGPNGECPECDSAAVQPTGETDG